MKLFIKDLISIYYSVYSRVFSKKAKRIIYLISFHRSGSTWVSEVLINSFNMGLLYEPLYYKENRSLKKISNDKEVIREEPPIRSKQLKYFKNLNSKRYLSRWSLSRSSLDSVLKSEILLVKFIRANLLYDFFEDNFKEIEKIILIRNPFAVIESVLNGGKGDWNPPSKAFLIQYYAKVLVVDSKLSHFIEHEISNSERCLLLLRWCIEYQEILPRIEELNNVFYYETLKESEEEQMKLLKLINKNNKINFFKNSRKSSTTSKVNTISKNTTYWISNYSDEEINEVNKILEFFKVTAYKFDEFHPNIMTQC